MQVTDRIHALKIPFIVPVSPEKSLERFAFVYLVFGEKIHVIDSGVAGTEPLIRRYIEQMGRDPRDIATLLLTHSHPDHVGAAGSLKERTGCRVLAHALEQEWIEDTELQCRQRPVPGFRDLVEGPVTVDQLLAGGETLELEQDIRCEILHTPGHSKGSLSLVFAGEKALFTGDALPLPGDLPIYEDIAASLSSIAALQKVEGLEWLLSSWEEPIRGQEDIRRRMDAGIGYLRRIHAAVLNNAGNVKQQDPMELCRKVMGDLGLPPFAANPLVAGAFASSLPAEPQAGRE